MLTVPLALILAFALTFLCVHGFTRPWWRSWESRAMMTSSAGWALLAAGFLVNAIFDVPDLAWVLVAYVGVAATLLKLVILFRSRRAE